MYLIYAVDPKSQRLLLISTQETASSALAAYAEAAKNHPELKIESAPGGLIDHAELANRAATEAV